MMMLAIVVSTMIVVALVVFAIEVNLYKKYEARRAKGFARKSSARDTREAPLPS